MLLKDFTPTRLAKDQPVILTIDKVDVTSVRLFFRLVLMKFRDNIASGTTVKFRIFIKDRDSNVLHDEVKLIDGKTLSYEIDYSFELSNLSCSIEVSLVSDSSSYGDLSAVDFVDAKICDNPAAFFLKTIKDSEVSLAKEQLTWIGELQVWSDEMVEEPISNFPYFVEDVGQSNDLLMTFSLEKDIDIGDKQMLVSISGERFSIEARRAIKIGSSFVVTEAQQGIAKGDYTWIDIESSANKILKGAKSEEILPLTKGRWLSPAELIGDSLDYEQKKLIFNEGHKDGANNGSFWANPYMKASAVPRRRMLEQLEKCETKEECWFLGFEVGEGSKQNMEGERGL